MGRRVHPICFLNGLDLCRLLVLLISSYNNRICSLPRSVYYSPGLYWLVSYNMLHTWEPARRGDTLPRQAAARTDAPLACAASRSVVGILFLTVKGCASSGVANASGLGCGDPVAAQKATLGNPVLDNGAAARAPDVVPDTLQCLAGLPVAVTFRDNG